MSRTEAMVDYWDRGVDAVPAMTGAASVMDGSDLLDALAGLGLSTPLGSVLDVGCGTGRLMPHCSAYLGVDISRDAVAYCVAHGVTARWMPDILALPSGRYDHVCCFSVFTHIDRHDRLAYLVAFASRAPELLVDIIPGDGAGEVSLWTADVDGFEADLAQAGFIPVASYERTAPDGVTHRYYLAVRR